MEMTQDEYDDRKSRVDAGTADDEDLRLVKLFEAEGFEPSEPVRLPFKPADEGEGRGAEDEGGSTSAGSNSERSSGTTPNNSETNEPVNPSTAPSTSGRSNKAPKGSSTASSAGTSSGK